METDPIFVAVTLPEAVRDVVSALPTEAQRGVRFTRQAQWHVTLRYLGVCDVEAALEGLERFTAAQPEVTLGPEVALLGTRVVMVPVSGLDAAAAAASSAFTGVGEEQQERPFAGHLTLARLKGAPLRDPSLVSVLGAPISATFQPECVQLIESRREPSGATYEVVAEKAFSQDE